MKLFINLPKLLAHMSAICSLCIFYGYQRWWVLCHFHSSISNALEFPPPIMNHIVSTTSRSCIKHYPPSFSHRTLFWFLSLLSSSLNQQLSNCSKEILTLSILSGREGLQKLWTQPFSLNQTNAKFECSISLWKELIIKAKMI